MNPAFARCPQALVRLACALSLALLGACGGGGSDTTAPTVTPAAAGATPATPTLADKVAVGDKLFHEVRLSAGGNLACATCHVENRGHADAEGTFLPLGGARLDQQGVRSSPSVRYLNANTAFRFDGQGNPEGGFTWDGRANDRTAQALGPLLAANEMANPDAAAVAAKTRSLSYFSELVFAYGLTAAASDAQVLQALQQALADYQSGDPDYEPFTSKFDAVQDGRAAFTPAEARGLAAFNDPDRGNCASCHSSRPAPGQARALFTNFGYFALGLPRNRSGATANPAFFDLGLCGPTRSDLSNRTDLCGLFKVPTLRNVALTAPYFHNASITTLEDAVAFYATRDTDPARWYPSENGVVLKFNDLPAAYRGNVTQRAPFGQRAGATPRLSAQEVQDIATFMRTLNDGFTP